MKVVIGTKIDFGDETGEVTKIIDKRFCVLGVGGTHVVTPIALIAEIIRLKDWKESQLEVTSKFDPQAVAKELNIPLGVNLYEHILPAIRRLKKESAPVPCDCDNCKRARGNIGK